MKVASVKVDMWHLGPHFESLEATVDMLGCQNTHFDSWLGLMRVLMVSPPQLFPMIN